MMRIRAAAVLACIVSAAGVLRAASFSPGLGEAIAEAYYRVERLKPMSNGALYTLTAGGKPFTGTADAFLRRRTGAEILDSGYSDGCGDNALAALFLIQQRGFEVYFVDSAEISTRSIAENFSGHAVLAVFDKQAGVWVRVDPTRRVYSWESWPASEKLFYGEYWVGYRGPLPGYPAHDPESLKKFYRDTLNSIPKEVLDRRLFRFSYTVDSSLIGPGGSYRNPNLANFLRDNGTILAAHGIRPTAEVHILLTAGGGDAESTLEFVPGKGWVLRVGLHSAMSVRLVSYVEERLNESRENGELHSVAPPFWPRFVWPLLVLVALAVILYWQRRRFAGRETAIAYWACQVLGWGLLPMLQFALGMARIDTKILLGVTVGVGGGIALTDSLRRVIRRRGWLRLSTGAMLWRLGLGVVAQAALETGALFLWAATLEVRQTLSQIGTTLYSAAFLFFIWLALYVLLTGPRRQREAQTELQLALREAELRALEAQIDPHFLFNCLNSIRALVAENPARSQDMLTRLGNILRYNLRHDRDHTVPLSSEAEVVADYLALETARFEERLRVEISIDAAAGAVPVPPMLLQSLVENAVKHGIAPRPEGGELSIRARVAGEQMRIEVENPGELDAAASEGTQVGLANIRERLRLLYHGRASFEISSRGGRVAATVLIPTTA